MDKSSGMDMTGMDNMDKGSGMDMSGMDMRPDDFFACDCLDSLCNDWGRFPSLSRQRALVPGHQRSILGHSLYRGASLLV